MFERTDQVFPSEFRQSAWCHLKSFSKWYAAGGPDPRTNGRPAFDFDMHAAASLVNSVASPSLGGRDGEDKGARPSRTPCRRCHPPTCLPLPAEDGGVDCWCSLPGTATCRLVAHWRLAPISAVPDPLFVPPQCECVQRDTDLAHQRTATHACTQSGKGANITKLGQIQKAGI
jgi:hypothetical protein